MPAVVLAAWTAVQAMASDPNLITLSIVGTTDVHGRVFADEQARGGLALFGGFIKNLEIAREADGGAVMLLDAGDTFQGGIESNLSEGGLAVDAYNALGYRALAVGNHDFEYGARDLTDGRQAPSICRGRSRPPRRGPAFHSSPPTSWTKRPAARWTGRTCAHRPSSTWPVFRSASSA
jgi:2',3'-cyclic-nucleotide 2'-phosphodiesterase (5'-nucleotidase family)